MVARRMAMHGARLVRSGLLALAFGTAAVSAQAQPALRTVIGAPYKADGLWWVPAAQSNYEAVGEARVAAPALRTEEAGELTAAHATLPLPSLVEVTNLDSGKTVRLRLTERGATAPGRVLDLSAASAQALGVQGAARVRVKLVSAGKVAKLDVAAPALRTEPSIAINHDAGRAASTFAVQAAAFGDRDRAEKAAQKLASTGRTEVSAMDRDGRRLWRVLVTAADSASAETARSQIAALGFADARVVRGS